MVFLEPLGSQPSTQYIMYNLTIRRIIYPAGKDDDLLDDSSSLVLEELLNDVATNITCPSDGEVRVSRHELTRSLFTVRVIFSPLSEPSIICHSNIVMFLGDLTGLRSPVYVRES